MVANQNLTVTNTASGPVGFVEHLDASFGTPTDNRIVGAGSISLLAAGANSTAMSIGLNTNIGTGALNGTIAVNYVSNGSLTSLLGMTTVGSQDVTVTGDIQLVGIVIRQAKPSAHTPEPVNLGNVRVGGSSDAGAVDHQSPEREPGSAGTLNASIAPRPGRSRRRGRSLCWSPGRAPDSTSLVVGLARDHGERRRQVRHGDDHAGVGCEQRRRLRAERELTLATQTVNVSGNVYNMAVGAATPDPVTFANRRVGDAATQVLTVSNTAAAGSFSEALNASFSAATGSASHNGGTISDLIAGGNNSVAMSVSLDTSQRRCQDGNVTLAYQSDGTGANGNSGLAAIAAGTQTIDVSGNVYNMAVGAATPDPIVMNRRVGDAATQALTVSNTAAAGSFSEALNASFSAATGSASHNGGTISDLIAGGNNSVAMSVSLDTASAGAKTGSVTLAYQSDGTGANGNSGLAAIAAGSQVIAVSGNVYQQAIGQVNGTTVDFGIVHVGDVVADRNLSVSNIAPVVALNDTMAGSLNGVSGPFGAVGSLTGLAAGQTDTTSLAIGLDTSAAGVFSDAATVELREPESGHGGSGHRDRGAEPHRDGQQLRRIGVRVRQRGRQLLAERLDLHAGLRHRVPGFRPVHDQSAGPQRGDRTGRPARRHCSSSSTAWISAKAGSIRSSISPPAAVSVGLMLAFDTSNLGFYADDIVLHGIGHNASGYSEAVDDITLRIRGNVVERTNGVPEPGALAMVALGLLLLIGARRRQSRGARTLH